jgi:hypothetical protein
MELAEKIHQCIVNGSSSHELLDVYNRVENADTLSRIYNHILENHDYSPHEALSDIYSVDELYAISSTENFIRDPNQKNLRIRDRHYAEIGYHHHVNGH